MNIGLGIGIPFNRSQIWLSLFDPGKLFTAGVNGVWYDPSDITTLYRDAAGTLPVTAVEQPVGLMLDKSKGLVLGPELVVNKDLNTDTWWLKDGGVTISGGTANWSSSPSNYAIYKLNAVSANTLYYFELVVTSVTAGEIALDVGGGTAKTVGAPGTYVGYCRTGAATNLGVRAVGTTTAKVDSVSVRELPGNHAFNPSGNSANFPVLSARVNLCEKSEFPAGTGDVQISLGFSTSTLTGYSGALACTNLSGPAYAYKTTGLPTTSGLFKLRAVVRMSDGLSPSLPSTDPNSPLNDFMFVIGGAGVAATLGSEVSSGVFEVYAQVQTSAGNNGRYGIQRISGGERRSFVVTAYDLRVANDALNQPAYQRVNTSTDYDTMGFKPYLKFNGTNQWLQTNSIDFSYGDKMFVSAGVRKLSDGIGTVAELNTTDAANGMFNIRAREGSTNSSYGFFSRGSLFTYATSDPNYPAPTTNVLSGIGNISGDQAVLRINGTQAATSTSDQGTGNYGNYPLYIGARAGSSLWFNGRLYGMVVAGKQASAAEIQDTEKYMNLKTAAYN